jgi:ankyrin repeat protein
MSAAGATPAAAIRNPEPELVALLLKAGADPNSADRAGRTPLMFAAAQGRVELVQVLLAGGAAVEAKAANGKTAWQVATGEEGMRVLSEARISSVRVARPERARE